MKNGKCPAEYLAHTVVQPQVDITTLKYLPGWMFLLGITVLRGMVTPRYLFSTGLLAGLFQ